jgi:hypothetical protein
MVLCNLGVLDTMVVRPMTEHVLIDPSPFEPSGLHKARSFWAPSIYPLERYICKCVCVSNKDDDSREKEGRVSGRP